MNVLAIDQGTSATNALVVAHGRGVIAEARVAVESSAIAGGGVEQDPEDLWQSVVEAARQAITTAHEPIAALGLANQGETVLAWDRRTGAPLSRAISWQDRRAEEICERVRASGERLHSLTGLPLDPYFAAPKMRWLRERVTGDGVCTTSDAWLLHRLCGAYATDAATASRTLLLDLDRLTWSPEACAVFDIDVDELPAIVSSAEPIGEARGLDGGAIPVAGLAVDQQAALFAEACFAPGEAKCTYGTGAFLLATVGRVARRSRSGLAASVAWRLGSETTYCLDGQVYTAGAAVTWLREVGLIGGPADLDRLAGRVDDSAGVVFVPGLAGLAAPFWRPAARGAFVGLSLATRREHLVFAVLEGIAAQIAWLARAQADELGGPLVRLRVDGGLTESRVLMQLQADLLQALVEVYPSPDATALGIAALTRFGIGGATSPAEAVGSWRPAAIYEPRVPADAAEVRLRSWRRAAQMAAELAA